MALLDSVARTRVVIALMRQEVTQAWACDKPALSAAVAAFDQWIEDNTASAAAALPAAFRNNSTPAQKALVFAYVLWRRIGRLTVTEDDS